MKKVGFDQCLEMLFVKVRLQNTDIEIKLYFVFICLNTLIKNYYTL